MEIFRESSKIPKQMNLILGFFDGVHAGHREVIKNSGSNKRVLITFSSSPAQYFGKNFNYIYPRSFNYKLVEALGVDYIYEQDFSKIATLSAEDYLEKLLKKFSPLSITTGFNHTFGLNKTGTPQLLEQKQGSYKYFCSQPTLIENEIVSSTRIKELLSNGEIEKANRFLTQNFTLNGTVIEGAKLGRTIGYPTANIIYPDRIIKIPYGVYKINIFGLPAVLNWGIKPTIGSSEILEIHIPNFEKNLYGQNIQFEIISKIRDEKKFNNLEELKAQIKKDVEKCLK